MPQFVGNDVRVTGQDGQVGLCGSRVVADDEAVAGFIQATERGGAEVRASDRESPATVVDLTVRVQIEDHDVTGAGTTYFGPVSRAFVHVAASEYVDCVRNAIPPVPARLDLTLTRPDKRTGLSGRSMAHRNLGAVEGFVVAEAQILEVRLPTGQGINGATGSGGLRED